MTASPPLVLHVIHQLAMGGLENGLINLINRMPVSAFRHAIACVEDYSDFRDRLTRPDVEVVALNRSRIGVWALRRALFRLCRRLQPAILHSRAMSGLDALLPSFVAGVPHRIHGEHGWDVNDLDGRAWKPVVLRRLHSPLVDRYVTVSRHLERYLVERVGIDAARITQIYNGVDTERFRPAQRGAREILPRGFAGDGSVIIGTVGRLQRVKDQATLLRAFAALTNRSADLGRQARLVILGDGPLREELTALVDSLGVGSRTWMPGAVANVPEIMRTFDVFVLPSLQEGISNTILEAMASAVPVIATATGGNLELVEDGRSGRFFAPGNDAALTALLSEYLARPDYRSEHAGFARRRALDNFALPVMVQRYQAVYERLSASRSPESPVRVSS
jgi:sugar transferase (PEP-CTERM/EpsH1 system associated)